MEKGSAARRYARAVFDLAVSRGEIDKWLEGLRSIRDVVRQSALSVFLVSPKIPFQRKKEMLQKALKDLDPLQVNLVLLLAQRGRLDEVDRLIQDFVALANEHRGIAVAKVTTAVPLDEQEAASVSERLSGLTGRKIVLRRAVDPNIIGGIVVRVGDKLIDGSIAGRLAALRDKLDA